MVFIFDVDGTLADTERNGHRVAFNQAFAEAGLDWYWSESLYGELLSISGGKERICHYITHYLPESQRPCNQEAFSQQLHRAKSQFYRQLLEQGKIPLRPGVKRLLEEAKAAGVRLAVATTSSLDNTMALLNTHLQGNDYFEVIAAGDIVANKKPSPEIYHYVLEQMNVYPQDCLVFEDSQAGLTASVAAGLKTVITVNSYTAHQDFSEAILVIDQLGEPSQPFTIYHQKFKIQQSYFDVNLGEYLINFESW
ncbi:MAG: HAD family hydrolase [Halothece sp.]